MRIGKLPLAPFLRIRPEPNKAGLWARDRQFESGSLQGGVRCEPARLVEIFDAQGVSFVSVTQQFNTTSSMGRLTLNVLLSFAQFERRLPASESATRCRPCLPTPTREARASTRKLVFAARACAAVR